MISPAQRVTVKKKPDVVNVDQNTKSQTVHHVHSVISAIQIVKHVNVISMELKATTVNRRMANARANQTLPAITVTDVLMVSMDQNVYHVIAT